MAITPLGFNEPDQGTSPWTTQINGNWALLDTILTSVKNNQTIDEASIASILSHQATDEAAITAAQANIAAIQAQSYPTWTSYTITVTGGHWIVNGQDFGALDGANFQQQVGLVLTVPGLVINGIVIKTLTAFTGSQVSATCSIGSGTVPDGYMQASGDLYDLQAAVSNSNFYVVGGAKALDWGVYNIVFLVTVSGLSKVVSNISAGSVKVSILSAVIP